MQNPESMDYTMLSMHPKVVEANAIVITEAQKVLYEAVKGNNRGLAQSANIFIRQPRTGRMDTLG